MKEYFYNARATGDNYDSTSFGMFSAPSDASGEMVFKGVMDFMKKTRPLASKIEINSLSRL